MAEELGHIDIRFPSAPGGSAGDTTGPLPTKIPMPDMGGGIANTMRAAMGDFTAIAKMIVGNVLAAVDSIKNFVNTTVSEIRERGKFSPDVMMENVAEKMQELSNQFQEAKVLGPLYAMVLRWYRELMQLLQPWKLLFQTILAFLAGAVLATITQIMKVVNTGLNAILVIMSQLLDALLSYIDIALENSALMSEVAGQVTASAVGLPLSAARPIGDAIQENLFDPVLEKLRELASSSQAAIKELRGINNNTSPQASGGLDWVGAQLREIASRSPNWSWRKGANPFYRTKGVGRLGGYP